MKTSLGDDCVAVNLDYDAVKEVVQNYHGDCERQRLRMRERGWKFTLKISCDAIPGEGRRYKFSQENRNSRFTSGVDLAFRDYLMLCSIRPKTSGNWFRSNLWPWKFHLWLTGFESQ